ncbi:hypothetical protein CLV48_11769 [Cecembia rubra]|uniref:Uncharacterized protein n=1 Tax=Cecembia rubra TaxID=1485585 RepID=A0A2P8DPZ0_9BACT|nr:hypothetical protein CLV48_11769 [Cecembia rubra]
MIHFILTRFIHISANIILSKTTNTQHSIPPPKPPPPQSHQTYALGLCRECHLHSRYFPHNALLYPCIPPTAMAGNTGIVKGHRPSFGIVTQVHTGTTEILGIPGGVSYLLLTYRTMHLLFHKNSFFFLYQSSRKGIG